MMAVVSWAIISTAQTDSFATVYALEEVDGKITLASRLERQPASYVAGMTVLVVQGLTGGFAGVLVTAMVCAALKTALRRSGCVVDCPICCLGVGKEVLRGPAQTGIQMAEIVGLWRAAS